MKDKLLDHGELASDIRSYEPSKEVAAEATGAIGGFPCQAACMIYHHKVIIIIRNALFAGSHLLKTCNFLKYIELAIRFFQIAQKLVCLLVCFERV